MGVQLSALLDMLDSQGPVFTDKGREATQTRIRTSDSTRRKVYCDINRALSVSPIFFRACVVPEHACIATSRIRLSSHRLRIETGRWSGVTREDRLCNCGEVQTEEHVLLFCPLTQQLRDLHPNVLLCTSIGELFELVDSQNARNICIYCEQVLKTYM